MCGQEWRVGNAPDCFSRGCAGHSHTGAGGFTRLPRVRLRFVRASLPGAYTQGASSCCPQGFQRIMDSTHHSDPLGHVVVLGGATTPAFAEAAELVASFHQFPMASQHVPHLHPLLYRLPGALLLPDCSLPGSWLPKQCSLHSQESLEWQDGGSHSYLLLARVPTSAFLCGH